MKMSQLMSLEEKKAERENGKLCEINREREIEINIENK